MNLREQFLKSGLITKKQAHKFEAEKKKQEHVLNKDKILSQSVEAAKQKAAEELALEFEKQKQADKELNKQRDILLAQRENLFRARQIINSNAQNQRSAEELYFFAENQFVRKVYVTAWQREMLARGALCIVRPEEHIEDFVILSRTTAKILLDICPEKIIVLHSEVENYLDIVSERKDHDE